jgi:hypothetical protein
MALADGDPLARDAVDTFLGIVGAEAGAMALRCLARGGVYVAGGIVPRLMERSGVLREAFLMRKGRERFHGILRVRMVCFVGCCLRNRFPPGISFRRPCTPKQNQPPQTRQSNPSPIQSKPNP